MTGAARYELWVWDSVNDGRQIGGNSLTGRTFTHTGVVAGRTYHYAVRAVGATGVDERMVVLYACNDSFAHGHSDSDTHTGGPDTTTARTNANGYSYLYSHAHASGHRHADRDSRM